METQNQLEHVTVAVRDDRTIEGVVRVRRVRARLGRLRFAFDWCRPTAVIVRDRENVRQLTIPHRGIPLWIVATVPVVAHIVFRVLITRGGRP